MIIVILINNFYLSFKLTGLALFYKDTYILLMTFATIFVLSWFVYLLNGYYYVPFKQIRDMLGRLKKQQYIYYSNKPKGEFAKTLKEIENLSLALLAKDKKLKRQQKELFKLAYSDHLTGLPNREAILDIVNDKTISGKKLLILSISLNKTDIIFALKGHTAFDKVILEAKERIEYYLPSSAIVGRLGNNQFCVLLPLSAEIDFNIIKDTCRSLQGLLNQPYVIEEEYYYLSSNIGISTKQQGIAPSVSELIHLADLAVLEKKEEVAPNLYLFHPFLLDERKKYHSLEVALRKAIESNKFQAAYQPIVSLESKSVSLETLARWKHQGQWISPVTFIPIIEQLDLMEKMTLQIAEHAARDWKSWKKQLPDLSHFSVNISPSLLKKGKGEELIQSLAAVFSKYQVLPHEVCLEITENILLEDSTDQFIHHCREMGFLLAVDDFGTGYSSMSYLAKYAFDVLKIDRSLIMKIETEDKQQEVAISIVNLAKKLNLHVIAEGVETKAQLSILERMGVNAVQGYYFSKPQLFNEWDITSFDEKRKYLIH